jgi:predicted nucleic acid-binding protein
MNLFVDTSAFYALLDQDDGNHQRAATAWTKILQAADGLITSNYVVVETVALLQHRIGLVAVRAFQSDLVPAVHVAYVDNEIHRQGMSGLLAAERRKLSLVDCVNFELMRHLGLTRAFTFDSHFRQQGFEMIP